MPDRSLNYRIAVNAAAGTAGVRDFSRAVQREMRAVDDSLTDTATASQRVVRAMNNLADQATVELRQASRAADELARAMGPEMAAALGRSGIAEKVGELNRMGLTFEDIEANADELYASMKRLDDVQLAAVDQGLGNLGGKLRDVRDTGDQSRSVLANMVGNSTQSLVGLGGILGDLSMALGQIGEYATEGNIGLKNLAAIAGPMAGLAAATAVLSTVLEGVNFSKTFRAEQIDAAMEALRGGVGVLGQLNDELATTGRIAVDVAGGGFLGLGRHAGDLADQFAVLQLSTRDYADLVTNRRGALDAMRRTLAQMVQPGQRLTDQQLELANAMQDVIVAAEAEARAQDEAGAALERNAGLTASTTADIEAAVTAWEQMRDPVAAMPAEFDRVATALRDGVTPAASDVDAIMDQLGLTYDAVFDAAGNLNDQLDDQTGKFDTIVRRIDGTIGAFDRLRGNLNFEETMYRFNVDFLTAIEKTRSGVALSGQEVLNLKQHVIDVGEEIGQNPIEVQTNLDKIDQGDIEGAYEAAQFAANAYRVRFTAELTWARNNPTIPNLPPYVSVGRNMAPAGELGAGDPVAARAADDVDRARQLDGWRPTVDVSSSATAAAAFPVPAVPVGVPVALNVDLRGAILGSRYDVVRTVRSATRDGVRLAGTRG